MMAGTRGSTQARAWTRVAVWMSEVYARDKTEGGVCAVNNRESNAVSFLTLAMVVHRDGDDHRAAGQECNGVMRSYLGCLVDGMVCQSQSRLDYHDGAFGGVCARARHDNID